MVVVTAASMTNQLEELANGLKNHKSRNDFLPHRHVQEFPSDSLFDQFARTMCTANTIPCKELLEAWVMALYVHQHFPQDKYYRIADLACSHGLVSWAWLLLGSQINNNNNNNNHHRSAVCVDVRMPGSAEKIANAMLQEWPQFKECWDYVEGSVDAIVPDSSTLLVGVHACGGLSDKVIRLAIQGHAPLALVPCCHTYKLLLPEERQKLKLLDNPSTTMTSYNLAEYIDSHRIQQLVGAGFEVMEERIPESITPKNRILLATPPTTHTNNNAVIVTSTTEESQRHTPQPETTTTTTITNSSQSSPWRMPSFSIPVADTPEAKAILRSLAGRAAANQRKEPPAPFLCLSLFISIDDKDLTVEALTPVAHKVYHKSRVDAVDQTAFWHAKSGRHAKTFRVYYGGLNKARAKELHIALCHTIPKELPGVTVRQIPN
jgi:hypothetical protein